MREVLVSWAVRTSYAASPGRALERYPGDEDFLPANKAKQLEMAGMLRTIGNGRAHPGTDQNAPAR